MSVSSTSAILPVYRSGPGFRDQLPSVGEAWVLGKRQSLAKDRSNHHALAGVLEEAVSHRPWKWPKRPIYFFADPHADAQAFTESLLASGGIEKQNKDGSFVLSEEGRVATFIIGGDCLDKGPSNLQLLRCVRQLKDSGARVKLLAGNHDVRLLVGLRAMSLERDP